MSEDKDLFGGDIPRLGAPLWVEKWSNRKAFRIGVMAGQGLSAPSICKELGDGSTPNLISSMLAEWNFRLPGERKTYGPVKVMLAAKHRTIIHAEAKLRGISMVELCRQVLVCIARDGIWDSVIEGITGRASPEVEAKISELEKQLRSLRALRK